MNDDHRAIFTLEDIRAIRLLVLALGVIGVFMFLVTDRETPPLMVIGFITIVGVVPLAAIYFLRRRARRRKAPATPAVESR